MAKAKGLRQKHRRAVEDAISNCRLANRKLAALIRSSEGLPPEEIVYMRIAQAATLLNEVVSDLMSVDFEPEKESE